MAEKTLTLDPLDGKSTIVGMKYNSEVIMTQEILPITAFEFSEQQFRAKPQINSQTLDTTQQPTSFTLQLVASEEQAKALEIIERGDKTKIVRIVLTWKGQEFPWSADCHLVAVDPLLGAHDEKYAAKVTFKPVPHQSDRMSKLAEWFSAQVL